MFNRMVTQADKRCLRQVQSFVQEQLEGIPCSEKVKMAIDIAVEEIFVNIALYAYPQHIGEAVIETETAEDGSFLVITFRDEGLPYDPLNKEEPDVTLPIGARPIGGLGIYLVKRLMDKVSYRYEDGQNMLCVQKYLKKN